jgi:hypothetical protein
MYRRTSRQVPLLSPLNSLSPEQQARIRRTWAEGFREKVYPLLLQVEDEFASLYAAEVGRPNWSVARKLGVTLLQGMLDMGDEDALDALSFDLRWQYALDAWGKDGSLTRRSLGDFRARLVEKDPAGMSMRKVFEVVLQGALSDLKVSTNAQRLDSTRILSNIHTRGRADLFWKTLDHFLKALSKVDASKLGQLPVALQTWDSDSDDKSFAWRSAAEARAVLPQLARWLVIVRDLFAHDDQVRALEAYQLVVRLLDEHVTVLPAKGGETVEPGSNPGASTPSGEPAAESGSAGGSAPPVGEPRIQIHAPVSPGKAMQSPYDPDAEYGHKGPGYHIQIAETCCNEKVELITEYEVHGASVSDQGKAAETLERLAGRGIAPEVMAVDSGYVSAESLADAEEREVELLGPVSRGALGKDAIGRDQWTRDAKTGLLASCPQGHRVVRHGDRSNGNHEKVLHAFMDAATCRTCPLASRCMVRSGGATHKTMHIEDTPQMRRRDERLRLQRDPGWRMRHRIRAGIEATNSELKRAHGLDRLRVRRAPRVRIAVAAKLTGCNIKRWLRTARN